MTRKTSCEGYVMENIADRARVEIAAVCTCGRSIIFVCSELRSKKKFSEIWETERKINSTIVMQCWHTQLDNSNETSLYTSETYTSSRNCYPLVFAKHGLEMTQRDKNLTSYLFLFLNII